MLKGLDPRLNADVLHALMAMGHGDTIVIADTNFPASSVAKSTVLGRPLMMSNLTTAEAIQAVLSVLPLDTFVDDFAMRMEVVGKPSELPDPQREVQVEIDKAEGRSRPLVGVERFAFYELAKTAYAVVVTGERRFYGCIVLRKGVIGPDA